MMRYEATTFLSLAPPTSRMIWQAVQSCNHAAQSCSGRRRIREWLNLPRATVVLLGSMVWSCHASADVEQPVGCILFCPVFRCPRRVERCTCESVVVLASAFLVSVAKAMCLQWQWRMGLKPNHVVSGCGPDLWAMTITPYSYCHSSYILYYYALRTALLRKC